MFHTICPRVSQWKNCISIKNRIKQNFKYSKIVQNKILSILKSFLQEQWSEAAFNQGLKESRENYMNFMRVLKLGESAISLKDLPAPLRVAIAYMPLYRECVDAGGRLLSQKLRGQLVEAATQLQGFDVDTEEVKKGHHQLMTILEHHLPLFLVKASLHWATVDSASELTQLVLNSW